MSHQGLVLKSTPVRGGLPCIPPWSLLLPLVPCSDLPRGTGPLSRTPVFLPWNPPPPPPSLSPCSPESQMRATVRVLPTGLGLRDLFQCPLDIACWWEPCLFRASGPRWSYFPGHQIQSLTQTQILGVLLSVMPDPEQVTGKQQFTG